MLKCNLRILMAEHKIDDITSLMERCNVSRNAVNKLYKEVELETVKLETLIKICNGLNCKLSDLIEYIPEK
jgi:putative transcriptional regulator